MMPNKNWLVSEPMPEEFILEHPELPPLASQLLWNRGVRSQQELEAFLNPDYAKDTHDPFLFRDMERAVARINSAILRQENLVIHGDYDADGISASVILKNTLEALGGSPRVFLPHREDDGYGLSSTTVERLAAEGTQVIVTCDCGISNVAEVTRAAELGIDVIITDHHQEPPKLPPAYAIIHPKVEGESYPFKGLAGGGVAFKLSQGLLQTHAREHDTLPSGEKHAVFEKWLLDMVAISSVADMVPLLGETRALVRYGLLVMEKTRRTGLHRLMRSCGILDQHGHPKQSRISTSDIGYKIAPRINAAGRMSHAHTAFALLTATGDEEAKKLAEELSELNKLRQQKTKEFIAEAHVLVATSQQQDDRVIVLCSRAWPAGLLGLIANAIKEHYHRPAIILSEQDRCTLASGRSTAEFNMFEGIRVIAHCFEKFGGHPQACGFTLAHGVTPKQLKEELTRVIQQQTASPAPPVLEIDAAVVLEDINWKLYDVLERFEPFGIGNEEPRFVAVGCTVAQIEPVGREGKHLRLHLRHNTGVVRKTIFFGGGPYAGTLACGDTIDIVFEAGVNEWNGSRELQLKIIDLKKVPVLATDAFETVNKTAFSSRI